MTAKKPVIDDPPPSGVHGRDTRTNTVDDAARYERIHGPVPPAPSRRIMGELVEDPPSEDEL